MPAPMPLPSGASRLLARLRPEAAPPVAVPLDAAWTSRQSWRVAYHDGVAWVLKPARAGPAGLIRAQHEFAAMQWGAARGLAPSPVALDSETGWLAHAYAPGATAWEDCAAAAARLQLLHAPPLPAWPRFDPLQAATASVAALRSVPEVTAAQQHWLAAHLHAAGEALARSGPAPLAPCHNDVQPFNLVRGPQVVFIDWEDAALGDPLWDAASWLVSLELPRSRDAEFLAAADAGANAAARLEAWRTVAEVYFLAWGLLRPAWRALELARLARLVQA